jgi:hypothetical protein
MRRLQIVVSNQWLYGRPRLEIEKADVSQTPNVFLAYPPYGSRMVKKIEPLDVVPAPLIRKLAVALKRGIY